MEIEKKDKSEKIVEDLNREREETRKGSKVIIAWAILTTIIFLFRLISAEHFPIIALFIALFFWIGVKWEYEAIEKIDEKIRCATLDIDEYNRRVEEEEKRQQAIRDAEYQSLQKEREYAEKTQREGAPWEVKYFTESCPYCGHYKVRFSEWEDKRYSIAFWGAASDKIGKAYKCEYCGKMW